MCPQPDRTHGCWPKGPRNSVWIFSFRWRTAWLPQGRKHKALFRRRTLFLRCPFAAFGTSFLKSHWWAVLPVFIVCYARQLLVAHLTHQVRVACARTGLIGFVFTDFASHSCMSSAPCSRACSMSTRSRGSTSSERGQAEAMIAAVSAMIARIAEHLFLGSLRSHRTAAAMTDRRGVADSDVH